MFSLVNTRRLLLAAMKEKQTIHRMVVEYRSAIRWHRDQAGKDRCWIDDWYIFSVVLDIAPPPKFPSFERLTGYCEAFLRLRRGNDKPKERRPMPLDPDSDLDRAGFWDLLGELSRVLSLTWDYYQIEHHRRKAKDVEKLYSALPEDIPADQWWGDPDELFCNPRGCIAFSRWLVEMVAASGGHFKIVRWPAIKTRWGLEKEPCGGE